MRRLLAAVLGCALVMSAQDRVDLSVLTQIKSEAFENSQVMDHLFYLTDVYGPRLTNSPGHQAAGDFVVKRLREYGLQNVKEEKWGPFGRGWRLTHFAGHMIEPQYQPLIGVPLAWTPGTNGVVTGEPVMVSLHSDADFERYRGKLRGKIALTMDEKQVAMRTQPLAHRLTDEEMAARGRVDDVSRISIFPMSAPALHPTAEERAAAAAFQKKVARFLKDEGVLLILEYGPFGDGGTVFAANGGSYDRNEPIPAPMVALTPEHYNRIARLLAHSIPVKLEFDIRAEFLTDSEDSFNVVGEIPGTTKKGELVMVGAHLDSWQGGTGATDNGTGSAVAIEAMRILEALHLPMARTVRVALWSGEEQGLLGSKAYVQEHFAKRDSMQLGAEYQKLSAYYNDDMGTGRFRGISVDGNDMARPIFEEWARPLRDLGFTAVIGTTAPSSKQPEGTDHTSFTWIGLPGFTFIQDPMEYFTRTHHSNMDVYDRVQPGDLMQAAAIEAWFVYNTAVRKDMMPRMAMPAAVKN